MLVGQEVGGQGLAGAQKLTGAPCSQCLLAAAGPQEERQRQRRHCGRGGRGRGAGAAAGGGQEGLHPQRLLSLPAARVAQKWWVLGAGCCCWVLVWWWVLVLLGSQLACWEAFLLVRLPGLPGSCQPAECRVPTCPACLQTCWTCGSGSSRTRSASQSCGHRGNGSHIDAERPENPARAFVTTGIAI